MVWATMCVSESENFRWRACCPQPTSRVGSGRVLRRVRIVEALGRSGVSFELSSSSE